MQPRNPSQMPAPPMITVGDIYYVLFKHKWKIVIFSLLGLIGGGLVYFMSPRPYLSEAQLMVKYVQEAKTVGEEKIRQMSLTTDAVMVSEASILASMDVLGTVVDASGPEMILGKGAGSTNRDLAIVTLKKDLVVDVPKRGNVMRVILKHKDPAVVQPLLRRIVDTYFKKHVETHRNLGQFDTLLTQETDQAKARLAETEEMLRQLKTNVGISSIEDAKKLLSTRFATITEELRVGELELEQRNAALKELQKSLLAAPIETNTPAPTNLVAETPKPEAKTPPVAPEIVDEYQRLLARLEAFRKREQELLNLFRPESPLVREARENVQAVEREKKEMIAAHPALAEETAAPTPEQRTVIAAAPRVDPRAMEMHTEHKRVVELTAKLKMLRAQLEIAKNDLINIEKMEAQIVPLQRKKDLEDQNYRYYATSLERARFDNSLSGGQAANLREIQAPSPPFREKAVVMKQAIMAAVAGILLGFGLAFVKEFVLDQSVRKATEVESRYQLPVFLTIPWMKANKRGAPLALLGNGNGSGDGAAKATGDESPDKLAIVEAGPASAEIAPWDEEHHLHPYSEALRDRLVSFFEMKGLTHKPKLIAMTSCSKGAGVTTLAAGLAASLSETGEGNVLLVDMNLERGAAHPFYRGKPACGLADVLDMSKRDAAQVQENLYMVQGANLDDRLPKVMPKRLAHLIPKLHASDYDYIIFDMPPVTQTSVTPRLAGFMDMVFMVVEDEKTNRDFLKQASALLKQSKTNLGAVFNKRRTYVPERLHQDF